GAGRPVDVRLARTEAERRSISLRHMTRQRHIACEAGGLWPAVWNGEINIVQIYLQKPVFSFWDGRIT
ncbi:MAG: hypothetical protein LUI14_04080, partial [Lachnospiraceae bacterium]|nr:hypothetical protein [Lachnospiraceae bacterium]